MAAQLPKSLLRLNLFSAVDGRLWTTTEHCLVQNVTPKDESVFDEKLSHKDTLPSHTLGIFKHEFSPDGKIKHTWFLRQFSKDEAARKVIYTFAECFSSVSKV